MGYLLTGGVAAFQIAILVTIIGAASTGRGSRFVTTAAWVLFTLFGSIFTTGLLLLQLITIFVAYMIGSSVARDKSPDNSANRPVTAPVPAPTREPTDLSWIGGLVGLIVVAIFFYNKTAGKPAHLTPPVTQAPQQDNVAPKPQQYTRSGRQINSRNTTTANGSRANTDLRHCLNLPSDAAIMRCANQGK